MDHFASLAVQNIQDFAILVLDPHGIIQFSSEGIVHVNGFTSKEVTGQPVSVFYPRQDAAEYRSGQVLETARREGKHREEGWRLCRDGSLFPAGVVTTPILEGEHLIGYTQVMQNLTEQRQADESLRASEERYRLLVEEVKDYGIFMMDTGGYITSWNEGARRINGYEAHEIIGRHFSTFYTEEDLKDGKPARELKIARETGKYEEEGWRLRKDGSLFWASIVITAVNNAERELVGFSKVTRNLTDRKEAEDILKASEERYRIMTEELKLANQELRNFAYVASHDLQEPLRKIQAFGDVLQTQFAPSLGDAGNDLVRRMQSAARRMQSLVQDLLAYSRLNNEVTYVEKVSLNQLVAQILGDLEVVIQEKEAEIRVDSLPDIPGSEPQLRQMFQNLLSNALKFSHMDRPPRIRVSSRTVPLTQVPKSIRLRRIHWVAIEVADNGIGFEEKYRDRIFQMFQRLHGRSQYTGTGIGLAICKKVAENHGGTIVAESTPGEGSTFTVYMPV
ncbi:sensor histidine kinase [Larkinella soli]|uniref:sensor histidine kinase n=1 Tax=Larkinella soli TaxID=1770527 RepID=UPI000FFB4693|nr:PAS domain S-box protein [Larkinella soli]